MSILSAVTGEMSDSKVAAVFDDEREARAIGRQVQELLHLAPAHGQGVTAQTAHPGRKLEPEGQGIFRTILLAHYRLGIAGLVAGALAFAALYLAGVEAVVNSPALAAMAISFFGGVAGLFAGGLVSLRPDHTAYLLKVRDALAEGRCAVVVHAFDVRQRDQARDALRAHGGETVATL